MNGATPSRRDEWVRYLLTAAMAGVISYFTAANQVENRVTSAEVTERLHFEEIQRSLTQIDVNTQRRFELIQRAVERIEATGQDRATGEPYSVQRRYEK